MSFNFFVSSRITGKEVNGGRIGHPMERQRYLNKRIISAKLLSLPMEGYYFTEPVRTWILPTWLMPISVHIAIQLTFEDGDEAIIEYGGFFNLSSDYHKEENPRYLPIKKQNEHVYFYLKEDGDGARFYPIKKEKEDLINYIKANSPEEGRKFDFDRALQFIAYCNFKGKELYKEINEKISTRKGFFLFDYYFYAQIFPCSVKNKMTLNELINKLLSSRKWGAMNYNFVLNNCQYFGAAIVEYLGMERLNPTDKAHKREEAFLPSCIIREFIKNEGITASTILTRIPIIGNFFDLHLFNKKQGNLYY